MTVKPIIMIGTYKLNFKLLTKNKFFIAMNEI